MEFYFIILSKIFPLIFMYSNPVYGNTYNLNDNCVKYGEPVSIS